MEFSSLADWKEKLISVSSIEGNVVIVEGKNDVKTLLKYGIKNIYPIKGKKFYDIVEELEYCNLCILLMDLDKQGEKIYQKLKFMLHREGIPTDSSFRDYLRQEGYLEVEKLPKTLGDKI